MSKAESTQALTVQAAPAQTMDLGPKNFEQALEFSEYLAESEMVPKDFQRKPGNCLIAMQWGAELGLKPLQALQSIAVINGRPAMWGDALLALVRASPVCEWVIEEDDGHTARCRVKRRGEPEQQRTFSVDDAKVAGLSGKSGPWTQYPKRMRQLRARAFALRDVFTDVLRGMPVAEEVMDIQPTEVHMGRVEEVRAELPGYPAADFAKNLPAWTKIVSEGKKTAGDLLATLSTKATFSEEQKAKILSLKVAKPEPENAPDPFVADMEAAEAGSVQ